MHEVAQDVLEPGRGSRGEPLFATWAGALCSLASTALGTGSRTHAPSCAEAETTCGRALG